MNKLSVENISYSYPKNTVLDNISFTCTNGVIALLGNNGVGKSTLMRILSGISVPSSGVIKLNDSNILGINNYPIAKVGYLPQNFEIFGNVSGYDFLSYVYDVKKISNLNKKQVLDDIINKFNLEDVIKKKFASYSGGYKRRLGIAQAVLGEPNLIIIDEPSVGLDPEQRIEFRSYLSEISRSSITLISTHIIEDVELYSDEVLILKDKNIKFQGTVENLISLSAPHIFSEKVRVKDLSNFRGNVNIIEEKRISDGLIKVKFIGGSKNNHTNKEKEISLENAYIYFQNK